ncbi:MAG TPA: DUF4142 domain-containing protein [Candidatus Elarobacter sp.]|jgi:putative membrane protein|nr:DUF4142 domain-containing protein [Candidatus Elarobacter sp.]
MSVRFSRFLLPLAVVLCGVPALAASPDAQFAMQAAQGGMAEVQLARLALSKSQNGVVKTFAQRMIADHTPNNAQLASIMRSEGLTVPTSVDPNSQAMMTRLQALSGRAFNRAYLGGQVRAHQQMQILLQSEINGGHDARLKAYARTTLPTINMHLSMAKSDVQRLRARRGRGGAMSGSMPGMSGGSMSRGSMSGGSTTGGSTMTSPMPAGSMSPSSGSMSRPSSAASGSPAPRPTGM